VHVSATGTSSASNPFADAQVIGLDRVYVDASAKIIGSVATNGTMDNGQAVLKNSAMICGSVRSPNGVSLDAGAALTGPSCTGTGTTSTGTVSAPPIEQSQLPTNISNARIGTSDPFVGPSSCSNSWDPTARTLQIVGGCELTLRGVNYRFCAVKTNTPNAHIYAAPGVRIYFEAPESCGQSSGTTQLDLNSNRGLIGLADPADLAIFFVGSNTLATTFQLESGNTTPGNCQAGLLIYAPRTDVKLSSNSKLCGSVLAKTIWVGSNSGTTMIDSKGPAPDIDLGLVGATKWSISRYVECSANSTVPATC
jgi:hypothetical protein